MPGKDGVFLARSFVEQLVVILGHFFVGKELTGNTGGQFLVNIVLKGRVVLGGQHAIDEGPLLVGHAKGFAHVAKILAGDGNLAVDEPVKDCDEFVDFLLRQDVVNGDTAVPVKGLDLVGRESILIVRDSAILLPVVVG